MFALLLALLLAPSRARATSTDLPLPLKRSIVKIFVTAEHPNYQQPWQLINQEQLSGSGAVIEGGRILTNAHVVSDAVYVQVRKAGDPVKYTARVEFVGHDTELAVLRVDDPAFYRDVKPLQLGPLPRQRDRVAVYGFPTGGDELSITEGTVSRIEVTRYAHMGNSLLTIQTDAAINPGNSGGPAMANGKLIGVSFQSYSGGGAENIGYIVPVTLIRRFLGDIKDGSYANIPSLGSFFEKLENRALRERYGLKPGQTGMLVTKGLPGSSDYGVLLPGDVVTAIDGHAIADDRTYEFEPGLRLDYSHIVAMHQAGDTIPVELLRDGKALTLPVKLKPYVDLVDGPFYDHKPTYFIYAGLVFVPLTRNYINAWDPKDQPTIFKYLEEYALLSDRRTQPVVLDFVLPDDVNVGYNDMRNMIIQRVNGRNISRMSDLVEAFKHPLGRFHVLEGDDVSEFGTQIVLDAQKADAANLEILRRMGIPADRSDDLRAPLEAEASAPRRGKASAAESPTAQ